MTFGKRRKLMGSLESTAMTDIVFLLLIFFLLSSSFILQTGIRVDLPQVMTPEKQPPKDVEVTLTADQKVYLGDLEVPWSQLRERLGERLAESASKIVVIKGDAKVELGRTVEVMDLARQLGAAQLAIAAQPVTDGRR
ncbi:MAG: biopolymer transporter ExbD [Candidatus Eisenbacteria bacterium]